MPLFLFFAVSLYNQNHAWPREIFLLLALHNQYTAMAQGMTVSDHDVVAWIVKTVAVY
jgi:hypothetical protein